MIWLLIIIKLAISENKNVRQVFLNSQVINVYVGQQFKIRSAEQIPYIYYQQIEPQVCVKYADKVVPKYISLQFLNFKQNKTPLYRIEDLYYDRPEVDSIIFGDYIVSINQRHKLSTIQFKNQKLGQMRTFNLAQNQVQLTSGHFIISQNSLLFFTHNYAFKVNISNGQMTYLKGYIKHPQYQYTIVGPNSKYLFIANGKNGIDIYQYSNNELNLLHNITFQMKRVIDIEVDYQEESYFYVLTQESFHTFSFNFNATKFEPPKQLTSYYIPYFCQNFYVLKNMYMVANCIDQESSILYEMWIDEKKVSKAMVRSLSFMRVKDLKATNEFIFVHGDSLHIILRSNIYYIYPTNYEKVGEMHFSHLERILSIPGSKNTFAFIGRQSVAIINLKEQFPYLLCSFYTPQKKTIRLVSYGRCKNSNENCKYIENVIINISSGWEFKLEYLSLGMGFVGLLLVIGFSIIYKKKREYKKLKNESIIMYGMQEIKQIEKVSTEQKFQQNIFSQK